MRPWFIRSKCFWYLAVDVCCVVEFCCSFVWLETVFSCFIPGVWLAVELSGGMVVVELFGVTMVLLEIGELADVVVCVFLAVCFIFGCMIF